uniref:Uncharacterized protein n=1 Tax=Haemonchus contortus TaxID=6289 RepID=A0A7I4YSM4_HAECO
MSELGHRRVANRKKEMQGSYIGMMNPKNTASLPPSNGKPFPTLSPYLTDIPAASSELAEIVEKNHWYTQLSPTIATALTPYFAEFTTVTPDFRDTTVDDEQSIEFKRELHQPASPTVAPAESSSNSTDLPIEVTKVVSVKGQNHWYTRLSSAIATALTPSFADITTTTPGSSDIAADNAESSESRGKLHQPTSPTAAPIDSSSNFTDLPTEITKINKWYTRLSPSIATALTPYYTDITTTTLEFSGTTADDAQPVRFEGKLYQSMSPAQTAAPIDSPSDSTDFPTTTTRAMSLKAEVNQWHTRLSATLETASTPVTPHFVDITTTPEFWNTTADEAQPIGFNGMLHQPTSPTVAPVDSSSNSTVLSTEITKTNQLNHLPQTSHLEPKDLPVDQSNSTGSSLNQKVLC